MKQGNQEEEAELPSQALSSRVVATDTVKRDKASCREV